MRSKEEIIDAREDVILVSFRHMSRFLFGDISLSEANKAKRVS